MKPRLLIVPLLVLFLTTFAQAQTEMERQTLKGLTNFLVLIESPEQTEAQKSGLSQEQIRTQVELRLRNAHIPVTNYDDWMKDKNPPRLPLISVTLHLFQHDKLPEMYAFSLRVELRQEVYLKAIPLRDQSGSITYATTWSTSMTGMVGSSNLSSIRSDILDRVDKFINDYLAANPTKP